MLTEVGHGLDIASTRQLQPDSRLENFSDISSTIGSKVTQGDAMELEVMIFTHNIHTRRRYMPPTIPIGSPTISVVFACLLVDGEDYGIRSFLVPLNNGQQMCRGVTARFCKFI